MLAWETVTKLGLAPFLISVFYILCIYEWKRALFMADGAYESGVGLFIIFFILLIIVGAAWYYKTPIMSGCVQNNTPVQSTIL
jgi:uncharacterized protein (TIGR01732 family)